MIRRYSFCSSSLLIALMVATVSFCSTCDANAAIHPATAALSSFSASSNDYSLEMPSRTSPMAPAFFKNMNPLLAMVQSQPTTNEDQTWEAVQHQQLVVPSPIPVPLSSLDENEDSNSDRSMTDTMLPSLSSRICESNSQPSQLLARVLAPQCLSQDNGAPMKRDRDAAGRSSHSGISAAPSDSITGTYRGAALGTGTDVAIGGSTGLNTNTVIVPIINIHPHAVRPQDGDVFREKTHHASRPTVGPSSSSRSG